jgi:hypothetical protein
MLNDIKELFTYLDKALMILDPEVGNELGTTSWDSYDRDWAIIPCQTTPFLGGHLDFSPWKPTSVVTTDSGTTTTHTTSSKHCLREEIIFH